MRRIEGRYNTFADGKGYVQGFHVIVYLFLSKDLCRDNIRRTFNLVCCNLTEVEDGQIYISADNSPRTRDDVAGRV
jgi:hypothetical protein